MHLAEHLKHLYAAAQAAAKEFGHMLRRQEASNATFCRALSEPVVITEQFLQAFLHAP